ncbi:hypothetical protein SBADM41S_12039 [Streptomyces badius]
MGETSSHRTWDRLREMHRLTGQFAGYAGIQDLREEIELSLPSQKEGQGARRSEPPPPRRPALLHTLTRPRFSGMP